MKDDKNQRDKVAPVTDKEQLRLREAIAAKFGYRLRAGETLSVDVERTRDHAWATVIIEVPDDSFRLECEAVSQPDDQPDDTNWDAVEQLQLALDLIDAQLEQYFDEERAMRFHDDWRIYDFEEWKLRFRGAERRPELEALADQWLKHDGPPDPTDMN